jgi:hypothetical protein
MYRDISNKNEYYVRIKWRRGIHVGYWWESQKERDH